MFKFVFVAALTLMVCNAEVEQEAEATHYSRHYEDAKNSGAELAGLAHNSAIQAKNAVQYQQTAGNQAAFGIKTSLATAATGAAQAAQAAVLGKQAIVSNLKQQLTDTQSHLQSAVQQYKQTENVAQATRDSAQQAQNQVSTLTAALAAAQSTAQQAGQAATEAAKASANQDSSVSAAKTRLEGLLAQFQAAAAELEITEDSAQKALESAQLAQNNAAAAGAAVAAANGEGGHSYHH